MPLHAPLQSTLALATTLVAFAACGGDDGGTTPDDGTDIERVTVSPTTLDLDIGEAQQLTAQVTQKNGELSLTAPTWTAVPQGVVSVGASGLVTGLAEGSVVVRASAGGRSGEATVTVNDPNPPAAPDAVAAEVLSNDVIEVSWNDNAGNEDEYRVEREGVSPSAVPGVPLAVFTPVATLPANTTSFRDEGLDPGTAYRYRVRACNENGCVPEGDGDATTGAVTTHETLEVVTTSVPAGVVGAAYSFALEASGGGPTRSWSVVAGTLPAGLELAPAGLLEGTPTAEGTFPVTFEVAGGEQSASLAVELLVSDQVLAPQIVTASLPSAAVGVPYAAALEAMHGDGTYAWAVAAGQLPDGLALNPTSGAIGGTPTAEGSSDFTIEVTSAEMTGQRAFTLVVHGALAVDTGDLPSGVVGTAYASTLSASGGDGDYTWSLGEGALPDGLTLTPGTGAIGGTPTAAGATEFTARVESGDGQTADAAFTLAVYEVLAVTTDQLPEGQIGQDYTHALKATGGDGDHAWSLAGGALPDGLSVDATEGTIEGAPTETGEFDLTLEVQSGDGQSAQAEFSLSVAPGPPAILTTTLPDGEVGVPYDESLAAVGGDGSYAWAVTNGALPDGLALDGGTGAITGTPTTEATADFTVEVTSDGQADTRALSITVAASASPLAITTTTLTDARDGVAYAAEVEASGGAPPYTFALASGALPGGILLGAASGELAGTPTAAGTASFTVQVTDDLGTVVTQPLTLDVCPAAFDLAVGQMARIFLPDGCGAVLPAVDGDSRVAVVARSAAYLPTGFKLVGTAGEPGAGFPSPLAGAPYALRSVEALDPGLPDEIAELAARTEALHHRLREEERRAVPNVPGAPPNRVGPPLAQGPVPAPARQAPANRTFWVTPGSGARVETGATLLGESSSVLYYADDAVIGTGDEPSQAQVDALLAYYEAYGKAIIDNAFGGLGPAGTTQNFKDDEGNVLTLPMGDLDENGKVIVLQVRPSYMPSGAAAYVSSCDRYPKSLANHNGGPFYCSGSNHAEITYFAKPDSDFYLGTLVHEVKHISSHGYAVFGGRGFNPSWIEEGTAEIAKEKSSRDAAGELDGTRVGLFDVYVGGSLNAQTFGMGVVLSRARAYLGAAPRHSLYGTPSPNPGNSTYYGASWLFHRFLIDQFGGGNEDAFMHALNTGGSGAAHIVAVTGDPMGVLWERFVQAIAVEGEASARAASANRFVSYDFDAIAAGFSQNWPYTLATSGFTTGTTTLPSVVYGGPSFFDFNGTGATGLRLDVFDGDDAELFSGQDVVLIVVRIR